MHRECFLGCLIIVLSLACSGVRCEDLPVVARECPQECVCYRELTTVKCHESSLTDLPRIARDLATQVEVLDMTGSQVQHLKSTSLSNFPRLKRLNLRNNKISTIDATALGNVPVLTDLDLRNNKLESLPQGIFDQSKLKVLFLAHNPFYCDASALQQLSEEMKDLMREDISLEMFDGGLLQCANPPNMKDKKIVSLLNTVLLHYTSSSVGKPGFIVAVVSGVTGLLASLMGAAFVILKRRNTRNKHRYDSLSSTEEGGSHHNLHHDQEVPIKQKDSAVILAEKLKKQRKQSQGYPTQDIIESDEEEAVDQELYIKDKMKEQRRHSMGYPIYTSDSEGMDDVDLNS